MIIKKKAINDHKQHIRNPMFKHDGQEEFHFTTVKFYNSRNGILQYEKFEMVLFTRVMHTNTISINCRFQSELVAITKSVLFT